MIYLDYSATTPPNKEVLDVFNRVSLEYFANSNSIHTIGMRSHELEIYITNKISKLLMLNNKEIIYTSGSSESNNLALKGICNKYKNRGKHIITTKLEHSSIIETVNYLEKNNFIIDYVNLTDDGLVDINHLEELINDKYIESNSFVDQDGNSCDLDASYVIAYRNMQNTIDYTVCLVCGDYKSDGCAQEIDSFINLNITFH